MDAIVALCKRRGFVFQSSEIYGGFSGLWDYGPLGVELKRNIKETWWRDMITTHDELDQPEGAPRRFQMVGIESSVIMHPRVWKTSGHYDLFHDEMVDCRETNKRYRYDHVKGRWVTHEGRRLFVTTVGGDDLQAALQERALRFFGLKNKYADKLEWDGEIVDLPTVKDHTEVLGPDAKELGSLTEPREFNLMLSLIHI